MTKNDLIISVSKTIDESPDIFGDTTFREHLKGGILGYIDLAYAIGFDEGMKEATYIQSKVFELVERKND